MRYRPRRSSPFGHENPPVSRASRNSRELCELTSVPDTTVIGKHMADVEWHQLPSLWPQPAVWTDIRELMPVVFTQDGVPTSP